MNKELFETMNIYRICYVAIRKWYHKYIAYNERMDTP